MARPLVAAIITAIALSGCRPPPPEPAPCEPAPSIELVVDGGAHLNPGKNGEPWPAHLQIYQLTGPPSLEGIEVDELTDPDSTPDLKATIVDRRQHVLYPESHERWPLALDPTATHLAIIGLFQRGDPSAWAALIALPPPPLCTEPAEPPRCISLVVDDIQVRGGLTPPADFVGDRLPCRALVADPAPRAP